MAAKTIGFAFSFVLPLVLVRVLDQTQFGLYKQVFLVVGTAQTVLPLGFGLSAFYFLAREPERRQPVVFNILTFNLAAGSVALTALALWPGLITRVFRTAELEPYAASIGLIILFWIFSSFLEIVATASQDVAHSTVFIMAAQLTKTIFMLCAALWAPSLGGLIAAAILQGIVQSGVLLWYVSKRFPGWFRAVDFSLLGAQLSYALPLGFAGLAYTVQTDLHSYFVSNLYGPAAYATYAVGCFQLPLISFLGESIGAVAIPRTSVLEQQGKPAEVLRLMIQVMRKLALAYWPVYVFLLVMAKEFITLLFTTRYLDSWPVFIANLTLIPLGIVNYDPVTRAYARHRYFLLNVRIILIVLLAGALWAGTARFGMVGAIWAVVLITVLERIIITWRLARALGANRSHLSEMAGIAKSALAAAAAGLAAAVIRALLPGWHPFWVLAITGVVFCAVYGVIVLVWRALTQEDLDQIRKVRLRMRAHRITGRSGT